MILKHWDGGVERLWNPQGSEIYLEKAMSNLDLVSLGLGKDWTRGPQILSNLNYSNSVKIIMRLILLLSTDSQEYKPGCFAPCACFCVLL